MVDGVVAAYMFDLDLNPASSLGHDAVCKAGRRVEIKLTQGASVAIRHAPDHLLVLHRPRGGPVRVVYNGPGEPAWAAAGAMQKNGQRPIRLSTLARLDLATDDADRLPCVRLSPISSSPRDALILLPGMDRQPRGKTRPKGDLQKRKFLVDKG